MAIAILNSMCIYTHTQAFYWSTLCGLFDGDFNLAVCLFAHQIEIVPF